MSVSGLETRQEVQAAQTTAEKQKKNGEAAAAGAPGFAAMLQGKLGGSMNFTRLDSQLTVPQRAEPDTRAAALREDRPASRDRGETNGDNDNGDVDAYDALGARESEAAAPHRHDGGVEGRAPADDRGSTAEKTAARADDAPDGTQTATDGRTTSENAQAAPGAAATASVAGNVKTATPATTQPQAQAQAAAIASQQSQATATKADAAAAQQTAQAGPSKTASQPAGDGAGNRVSVTTQPAQIASQPQTSLGAASAVNAETARAAQARGDKPAEGSFTLALSRAGERAGEGKPAGDGNTSNAAPSAQAAKARAAAAKAAAGPQQTGTNKSDSAGPQPPQSGLGQPAAPAMPKPTAPGLQTAFNAGGRATPLSGSGQPTVQADALTGGSSVSGQNNAVQHRTAPQSAPATGRSAPPPLPVADQVAVQIQRAAGTGADRISVQLKPAELGRIEIKMEMAHDGRMTAVISADKAETLDMLRQDSRHLLQTLNDAGLKADQNSLSFNLRGDQQQTAEDGSTRNGPDADGGDTAGGDGGEADPFDDIGETGGFTADGRLNMRV